MSDTTKQDFLPDKVILHCSASKDYPKDNKAFDLIGAADIDAWHKARGWEGIGYHFVIRQTGVIEHGRDLSVMGAHCKGHNKDTIGVCIIGNGDFNKEQIDALEDLYHDMNTEFGITWQEWFGHREFTDKKTCPNNSMELVRAFLRLL